MIKFNIHNISNLFNELPKSFVFLWCGLAIPCLKLFRLNEKNNFYTIILGILYTVLSISFLGAEEFDYGSFPDPFIKDLQRIQQEAAFNAACLEDPDSNPECPGYTYQDIEEETIPLEGIEELFNLSIDSEKIISKPGITIFKIEHINAACYIIFSYGREYKDSNIKSYILSTVLWCT